MNLKIYIKHIKYGGEKLAQFWFRYQSGLFVVLLMMTAMFIVWMWYQYLYRLGADQARLDQIVQGKEEIVFQEDLYISIQEDLRGRQERFQETLNPKELFVPIPEEIQGEKE